MGIISMIRAGMKRVNPFQAVQEDTVGVSLPMLTITLHRKIKMDVPHEVTIIVPRAEIRLREKETELIYSSITVVHAPRHPLAGEQSPGDGQFDTTNGGESETPNRELPDTPSGQTTPAVKVNFTGKTDGFTERKYASVSRPGLTEESYIKNEGF